MQPELLGSHRAQCLLNKAQPRTRTTATIQDQHLLCRAHAADRLEQTLLNKSMGTRRVRKPRPVCTIPSEPSESIPLQDTVVRLGRSAFRPFGQSFQLTSSLNSKLFSQPQ